MNIGMRGSVSGSSSARASGFFKAAPPRPSGVGLSELSEDALALAPLSGSEGETSPYARRAWTCELVQSDSLKPNITAGVNIALKRAQTKMTKAATFVGEFEEVQYFQASLLSIVESAVFSAMSLAAIVGNSIFIGVQTQHNLQNWVNGTEGETSAIDYIDFIFCAWFVLELFFRMFAGLHEFVRGEAWKWNLFDAVLVVIGVAEIIAAEIASTKGSSASTGGFMRILRIVRMVRILRIIRVMRFFRSLRLMIYSIVHSLMPLLWVFMLLFCFMYGCAIFILQQVLSFHKDEEMAGRARDTGLMNTFDTVMNTMQLLFMCICGGVNWGEVYLDLDRVSWFVSIIFLVYIFFVMFGVLNVVTGAFVDSMRLVSQRDQDYAIEEELKCTNRFRTDVTKIFEEADADDSGTLCWEEFEAHLVDERVKAYFKSLELDTSEARALFVLLDVEETNEVPIEKFIDGCMKMRGDAKSIDVNMLLYENEKMLSKITSFTEYAEEQFDSLSEDIAAITGRPMSRLSACQGFPADPSSGGTHGRGSGRGSMCSSVGHPRQSHQRGSMVSIMQQKRMSHLTGVDHGHKPKKHGRSSCPSHGRASHSRQSNSLGARALSCHTSTSRLDAVLNTVSKSRNDD